MVEVTEEVVLPVAMTELEAMAEELAQLEAMAEELAQAEAMEEEVVAWPEVVMEVGLADREAVMAVIPEEVMV